MKLSIVYDTRSGNTAHMAEYIIEGMRQIEGVEARAFDLDAVDEQYVRESAALIVGTPTYNGTFTARLKGWLESAPSKLKLAGKLGGAYAAVAMWRYRQRLCTCLWLECSFIQAVRRLVRRLYTLGLWQ